MSEDNVADKTSDSQAAKARQPVSTDDQKDRLTYDKKADDPDPSRSSSPLQPTDFAQLIRDAEQYVHSPEAGKAWLKGFGAFLPGTEVSVRLLAKEPTDDESTIYPRERCLSLLPVLTMWLFPWYTDTNSIRLQAKKVGEDRLNRSLLKQEAHFQWLLSYVVCYLSLQDGNIEESDIIDLAKCVLKICVETSEYSHFEQCLNVLYRIIADYGCPPSILEPALTVLCSARGSMSSKIMPPRATDCVNILLKGPEQNEVIKFLYSILGFPFDTSDSRKDINAARGSAQILREILPAKDEYGAFVVEFNQLVDSMLKSSNKHIIKLDIAILGVCQDLLDEGIRLRYSLQEDWSKFVEIISNCVAITSNTSMLGSDNPSVASNNSKSESAKHHNEVLRDINGALERAWNLMNLEQKFLVYKYYMRSPDNLSEVQGLQAVEYIDIADMLLPDRAEWQQDLTLAVDSFLKDVKQPVSCRLRAIETIAGSLVKATTSAYSDPTKERAQRLVVHVLQALQDQLSVESDDSVTLSLVSALIDNAVLPDIERDHVQNITQTLLNVAMKSHYTGQRSSKAMLHATSGIGTMLIRGLPVSPRRTNSAFQALVKIASLECATVEARLIAMKILFRLRCDSAGRIYLQYASESEYIAAALCRTAESAEAFGGLELATDQRSSESSSTLSSKQKGLQPLWMYPESDPLPDEPTSEASYHVVARGHEFEPESALNLGHWIETLVGCLQKDTEWETYSYIVVHLGAQLSNVDLFKGSFVHVNFLRRVLCEQIVNASFFEPPTHTGLKKSDVAICIFNVLTPLISYTTVPPVFTKSDSDEIVRAFATGIGGTWEGTSRGCIHSMSICCLETPASVARHYPMIIDKMGKNVTQAYLSMHILEFLAELARLPDEHANFREEEIRNIFGICIKFLEIARERKSGSTTMQPARMSTPSRHSGVPTKKTPPYRAAMLADLGMPQYLYALAYHTMIFWFLSLKLETRHSHVSWIVDRLVWKNAANEDMIDEQSQVFIDMMQRTAFSDLGETLPDPDFARESDGVVSSASWIVGLSIVTIETAGATGRSQITKRQASGTTHSVYQQFTAEIPLHHVPISTRITADPDGTVAMLPPHILLQLVTSAAPTRLASQPIPLPKDDFVKRALAAFDRHPTVDGHKMGVIYIGKDQIGEAEILANTNAPPAFWAFLDGLGTRVTLEDARFNTQGLVYEQDGYDTYAWRDRISEIVYHIPIMMPTNLEDDPKCVNKKRHIGNDFVNIIFNHSGKPFDFDTFPSDFNYVNIVITPATRAPNESDTEASLRHQDILDQLAAEAGMSIASFPKPAPLEFYKVHVLTAPGMPSISPASDPKLLSAAQLPALVRLVGLNASVFSQAWLSRDSDADYPSSWRSRLQEIRRLRDRVVQRAAAAAPEPARGGPLYRDRAGGGAGERKSLYPEDRSELTREKRRVDYDAVGATAGETLSEQLDFSKWTV